MNFTCLHNFLIKSCKCNRNTLQMLVTVLCLFRWQYIQLLKHYNDCFENMGLNHTFASFACCSFSVKPSDPQKVWCFSRFWVFFSIKIQFTGWSEKIGEGSKSWKSNLTFISKHKCPSSLLLFTLFFSAWKHVQSASLLDVTECVIVHWMALCTTQSHTNVMIPFWTNW